MTEHPIVAAVVTQTAKMMASQGCSAELLSVDGTVARVRYYAGTAPECADGSCLMPGAEFRELLLENLRNRRSPISDVVIVPA